MFFLFLIALIFLAFDVTAGVFMLLSVFGALGGSYYSARTSHRVARKAIGWMLGGVSKNLILSQGLGLVAYGSAFIAAISSSGDEGSTASSYPYRT